MKKLAPSFKCKRSKKDVTIFALSSSRKWLCPTTDFMIYFPNPRNIITTWELSARTPYRNVKPIVIRIVLCHGVFTMSNNSSHCFIVYSSHFINHCMVLYCIYLLLNMFVMPSVLGSTERAYWFHLVLRRLLLSFVCPFTFFLQITSTTVSICW